MCCGSLHCSAGAVGVAGECGAARYSGAYRCRWEPDWEATPTGSGPVFPALTESAETRFVAAVDVFICRSAVDRVAKFPLTCNTVVGAVGVAVGGAGREVGVGVSVGSSAVGVGVGGVVAVGGVGAAVVAVAVGAGSGDVAAAVVGISVGGSVAGAVVAAVCIAVSLPA